MTKISTKNRREVIRRAKGFCEYCCSDSKFADSPFDIDHIIPESEDGKSELENLALACHGCNLFKSNKQNFFDSFSDKEVRLFNPRIDSWNKPFAWKSGFSEIVGLTATKRATVEALKLNREGLVNQRKMLYTAGKHPPE